LRINLSAGSGGTVFDLHTGQALSDHNSDSTPDIDLKGGGGRLLFVGSQSDFDTLRAQAGITKTYAIAGRALMNADQIANIEQRLVKPAQQLELDSGYAHPFYELELDPNTRYRFDATVSTDTATFGAKIIYYDSSYAPLAESGIGMWALSASTPTRFASMEFVTGTPAAHIRLVLYRIGGSGRVSVKDAWLETLNTDTRMTADSIEQLLPDPGKTYRVAVNARALAGETSTLGIRWFNCYDPACGSKDGGHDLVINAALTTENQLFQPETFKSADPTATGIQVIIHRANAFSVSGNTVVIERASAWATD
jgi:hypothetical protein